MVAATVYPAASREYLTSYTVAWSVWVIIASQGLYSVLCLKWQSLAGCGATYIYE